MSKVVLLLVLINPIGINIKIYDIVYFLRGQALFWVLVEVYLCQWRELAIGRVRLVSNNCRPHFQVRSIGISQPTSLCLDQFTTADDTVLYILANV